MSTSWSAYLLMLMFTPLRGGEMTVRQRRIVEEVYRRCLTRVIRRPRSRSNLGELPVWIRAPDFPVQGNPS